MFDLLVEARSPALTLMISQAGAIHIRAEVEAASVVVVAVLVLPRRRVTMFNRQSGGKRHRSLCPQHQGVPIHEAVVGISVE